MIIIILLNTQALNLISTKTMLVFKQCLLTDP